MSHGGFNAFRPRGPRGPGQKTNRARPPARTSGRPGPTANDLGSGLDGSHPGAPPRLEAGATIDGTIQRRLERDGGLLTARAAGHLVQLPGTGCPRSGAGAAAPGPLGTLAVLTALRLVLEPLLREEFLFPRGEDEGLSTIDTRQGLVLEGHKDSSIGSRSPNAPSIRALFFWMATLLSHG